MSYCDRMLLLQMFITTIASDDGQVHIQTGA
jgi:hypothetical protein